MFNHFPKSGFTEKESIKNNYIYNTSSVNERKKCMSYFGYSPFYLYATLAKPPPVVNKRRLIFCILSLQVHTNFGSPTITGRLIKLVLTCTPLTGNPCLLFKLLGNYTCKLVSLTTDRIVVLLTFMVSLMIKGRVSPYPTINSNQMKLFKSLITCISCGYIWYNVWLTDNDVIVTS